MENRVETMRLSWADVIEASEKLGRMLLDVKPFSAIIAVSRGGLIPAGIVSQVLNIKLVDTVCIASYDGMDQKQVRQLKSPQAWVMRTQRVLVVDDICDTGETFKRIKISAPLTIFAAVYAKPTGFGYCHHYAVACAQEKWVEFPWEQKEGA